VQPVRIRSRPRRFARPDVGGRVPALAPLAFLLACRFSPMHLYQVDAFTDTPFCGNPAAVCLLSMERTEDWMQQVAAEMNLSETAFLRRRADGTFRLRWFTPTDEVDLCGHATLAGAYVLWSEGYLAPDEPARFDTASGRLTAHRQASWVALDFPTDPPRAVEAAEGLLEGLGIGGAPFVGRTGRDYFVQVADRAAVEALAPAMDRLAELDARGVIATARAGEGAADFVSRFFAPGVGVPEDPVTGSAHCALGPFWAARTGRKALLGRQVSARGGSVRVEIDGAEADRLTLQGQAVTVVRGRLDG
jgi:PhzF family phenazine biosynthesis protein